jgi:hypothetical protein
MSPNQAVVGPGRRQLCKPQTEMSLFVSERRDTRSVSRTATTLRRVNRILQTKSGVSRFSDARYEPGDRGRLRMPIKPEVSCASRLHTNVAIAITAENPSQLA